MGTTITAEPTVDELGWITRFDPAVITTPPPASNNAGTDHVVESKDVTHRKGTDVTRCTVERLMLRAALRGVIRGKVMLTTAPDTKAPCPLDRVNCQFKAQRPN